MWVSALLSGDYPQGLGALHTLSSPNSKEGFCCLGVLCQVAVKAGFPVRVAIGDLGDLIRDHAFYDGYGQYLPPSVAKWAGLYEASEDMDKGCNPSVMIDAEFIEAYSDRFGIGSVWDEGCYVELAELNDSPIQPDLIAGLIDRNL